MIKVKEYLRNVGKSTIYAASDVLGEHYSNLKDFKNTNREVFTEAYVGIKDYKKTFNRVKTSIQKSDVYTAASLGINNVVSDLQTGNFYNKERENEYSTKYGGDLMSDSDWDMDDSNFDWDAKSGVTDGEKIIATAIKKNNKMSTYMMADSVAKGHKAIVDSSRENTTMLYVQQEKLLNKVGGGIDNITSLLRSNIDNTSKVQGRQIENTNRFFTSMEKKTDKIVAQLDEMIQMQRNLYKNELDKEKERKRNTVTDIANNGIPDLKEYGKIVKTNIKDFINQQTGGVSSMGDALGGSNMFAMMMSNPIGELMKMGMNKSISSEFKKASKDFDKSIKGYFSTLMAKANKAKNSEDPFMKTLGSIFGIKIDKESDNLRTDKYVKGSIPFDGITKKAITDVMPYYLRKITSMLTGDDEQVFDYKTGRWTTIKAVQQRHNDWKNAGAKDSIAELTGLITEALGKNPSAVMTSSYSQDRFKKNYDKMAEALYRSNGDLGILNKGMENGINQEFLEMIKQIISDNQYYYKLDEKKKNNNRGGNKEVIRGIDRSKGANGIRSNINTRSTLANLSQGIFSTKASRAGQMRSMESESDIIERLLYAEGIVMDPKSSKNPGIRNKHGDYDVKKAFESPLAQAMKYVKDEYDNTIFNYLQGIKRDLTAIRSSGLSLLGFGLTDKVSSDGLMDFEKIGDSKDIYNSRDEINKGGKRYRDTAKNENRQRESYDRTYKRKLEEWEANGKKGPEPRKVEDVEDLKYYLSSTYSKNENSARKSLNDKKDIYDVAAEWGWLKKDEAAKYKEISYNTEQSMKDNFKGKKGFEKVALLRNYANKLVQKPWQAATDSIITVDKFMSDLFFGKDLARQKEDKEDKDKGLFARIKDGFTKGFDSILGGISDKFQKFIEGEKFQKFKDKYLTPIKEFLIGKQNDSEDTRSGGLFGGVIGGAQKFFRKNAEDVKKMGKSALEKVSDTVFGKDESSSFTGNDSVKQEKMLVMRFVRESNDGYFKDLKDIKTYIEWAYKKGYTVDDIKNGISLIKYKESRRGSEFVSINDYFLSKNTKINPTTITQVKKYIINNGSNTLFKNEDDFESYLEYVQRTYRNGNYRNAIKDSSILKYVKQLEKQDKWKSEEGRNKLNAYRASKGQVPISENNEEKATEDNTTAIEKITNPVSKIAESLEKILDKLSGLNTITNPTQGQGLAKGGINTSGKAFHSVVSSGEIVNGGVVPPGGPYVTTIPKGGYVINPANASTRSKQAGQEKSFINKLKSNANANDGLQKATVVEQMKDPENQKFAGEILARGGIGLGAGMLLGMPLLSAGIGIASGFTKKSNWFSNALFGKVTEVDENGNATKRDNDGLISESIQKAFPDAKKFGLAGGIAGLITPLGPIGGLLVGSAIGFAKNNDHVQDFLFGDNGIFDKEKRGKIKKALPAMGIGAAAGALLGPFGLVGNAVLGATAGYVTSMDKFKEAIFGKEEEVTDEEGNTKTIKKGGLIGKIKGAAEPLKDFGKTIADSLADAILGKKGKDGKRTGGIMGMVKDHIVSPIAEGLKPILQETKLMFKKTLGKIPGMVSKYMKNNIGSRFGNKVSTMANKVAKAGINVGKGALWVGATPLMLGATGIKQFGGYLRRKQIRKGEASDMTAAERLNYRRNSKLMSTDDSYSGIDNALEDWSANNSIEDMEKLRNQVMFASHGADEGLENSDAKLRTEFSENLDGYVSQTDARHIMKYIKGKSSKTDFGKAERIIRGLKTNANGEAMTDAQRNKLLYSLSNLKSKRSKLKTDFENVASGKAIGAKELQKMGFDVNLKDKKSAARFADYLDTEITHKKAGMSPDEDPNDPLNKNTKKLEDVNELLEDIIKVFTGQKSKIAKKYGDKTDEEEKESSDNNEEKESSEPAQLDMDPAAVKKRLIDQVKDTKEKQLIKNLTEEAGEIWSNALIKAQEGDPVDGGYSFVIDNVLYRWDGTDKGYNEELERFVNNYISEKYPTKFKKFKGKIWDQIKRLSPIKRIKKLGMAKFALLLTLGPGPLLAAVGGVKLAKWGLPKAKKGIRWAKDKTVKGIKSGLFGWDKKTGEVDENGNEITEHKNGLLSGISNRVKVALNNKKELGKKASTTDKIISAIHDLPGKISKNMEVDENGKPGLLRRIFGKGKWVVGVPLMVGFLNQTMIPFLKNKVGPLLLGKKNQEGEYEGGLISGIVNPLKKALKWPFTKVKEWFTNTGSFSDPTSGMKGMMHNFKSIAKYLGSTWLNGAETIFQKWMPKAVGLLVRNLPAAIGAVLENIWPALKSIWNSKDKTRPGSSGVNLTDQIAAAKAGESGSGNSESENIPFFSTFGQTFTLGGGSISSNSGSEDGIAAVNSMGNKAAASLNNIKSVSSSTMEVVSGGEAYSGDQIYYAADDKKKTTPLRKDPVTGEYYKASDLSENANTALKDNDVYQSMKTNEADPGGEAVNNNNTFGERFIKNAVASGLGSSIHSTGRKIGGKLWQGSGKILKHIPFMGTAGRLVEQSGKLLGNTNISKEGFNAAKDAISSKAENAKFIKEWMTDPNLSKKDKITGLLDWNGGITKIKQAPGKLLESAKSKVDNVAKAGVNVAKEVNEKGLKTAVKDKAKSTAKNIVEKAGDTKGGGVIKKIIGFLKKILNKVLASGPVKKLLAKMGKEGISEAAEKALKEGVEKVAKEAGESLAKKGIKAIVSIPAKLAAKVSPAGIAFVVADFVTGMGDARNILKITSEDIDIPDKIIAGFSKVLSGLLFILPESTCASLIMNTIGKVLFKDKVEEIQKEQKDSEEALKAYNEENGTDLSIEEYNNKFNATWYTKAKGAVKKATNAAWKGIKKVGKGLWDNSPIGFAANAIKGIKDKGLIKGVGSAIGKTAVGKAGKWLWGKIKGNAEADDGLEEMSEEDMINATQSTGIGSIATSGTVDNSGMDTSAALVAILAAIKELSDKIPNLNKFGKFGKKMLSKGTGLGLIGSAVKKLKSNADANDGLESLGVDGTIDNSMDSSINGFDKMGLYMNKFISQNKTSNDAITAGKIDPSNKNFWKIKPAKSGNPVVDSMLKMREYMSRLIKAPFSLVADTMNNVNNIIGAKDQGEILGSSSSSTSSTASSTDTSSKETIWTKIKNKFKGIFGKGTGKGQYGTSDPDHIYQRDYNTSYQTSGDSERQTLADSGCGPAAAATVANRYGQKDTLPNAANYAKSNGYKEVNGGTYPGYFGDYLSKKGISTKTTKSNVEVVNSLAQGKPVIMMGQDFKNSGKTPYGSKYSHYVVATGLDKNGNVIVEDSEDKKSQTKYSLADTLKNTSVKITTSGSGKFGRGDGALSVLSSYSNNLVKGIYGPYYSALFGDDSSSGSDNNNNTRDNSNGTNGDIVNNNASLGETGDTETNKKAIWDYYINNGFSKEATAGIIGNMMCEDGTLTGKNSSESMNSSGSYDYTDGIIQWDPFSKHVNWASENGYEPYDLEGQLKHVAYMIDNNWPGKTSYASEHGSYKTYETGAEFRLASGVADAAVAFERNIEISGAWSGYSWSDWDQKRIQCAQSVYDQFAGSSGSGRGRSNNSTHISMGRGSNTPTNRYQRRHKNYSAKSLYSNKYGKSNLRGYYGRGDRNEDTTTLDEENTDTTEREGSESSTDASSNTSLLENIGNYAGQLMKGVYGDYWTAMFGSDDDTSRISGGKINNVRYGSNSTIASTIYNATLVFAAMSDTFDGTYSNSSKSNIEVNGYKLSVRRDCSGFMGAILNAMGYNMPDCDGNGTIPGAGDFGTEGCSSAITNIDGSSCEGDWTDIAYDEASLMAGDFVSDGNHVEMYVYTDVNGYKHGYNAGATDAIQKGFKVAKKILEDIEITNKNNKDTVIYHEASMAIKFTNIESSLGGGTGMAFYNANNSTSCKRILRFTRTNMADYQQENINSKSGSGRGKKYGNTSSQISSSVINHQSYRGDPINSKYTNSKIVANQRISEKLSSKSNKSKTHNNSQIHNISNTSDINNTVSSIYGRGYFDSVRGTVSNSNSVLDNSQLISILEIIADNSNKTDQIVQLLAAIVTNTSVSNSPSNNTSKINQLINQIKNNSNNSSAPLTGLNQTLNNDSSNIANAVYSIAKS